MLQGSYCTQPKHGPCVSSITIILYYLCNACSFVMTVYHFTCTINLDVFHVENLRRNDCIPYNIVDMHVFIQSIFIAVINYESTFEIPLI